MKGSRAEEGLTVRYNRLANFLSKYKLPFANLHNYLTHSLTHSLSLPSLSLQVRRIFQHECVNVV